MGLAKWFKSLPYANETLKHACRVNGQILTLRKGHTKKRMSYYVETRNGTCAMVQILTLR